MNPAMMSMLAQFILPMVSGSAGKGGAGGSSGMDILGKISPMISSIAGTGIGVGQIISGKHKKKQAEGMFPTQEDPEMRAYLNDVGRQKRSFKTGSAYAESIKELKAQEALTNKGILSASGGASGAAISGLSRVQSTTGDIYGRYVEKGQEQENFLEQLYGQTLGNMSQRKLELNLLRYNQKMTEASDLMKHGRGNAMAGFSFLTGKNNQSPAAATSNPTSSPAGAAGLKLPNDLSGAGEFGDTPMMFPGITA